MTWNKDSYRYIDFNKDGSKIGDVGASPELVLYLQENANEIKATPQGVTNVSGTTWRLKDELYFTADGTYKYDSTLGNYYWVLEGWLSFQCLQGSLRVSKDYVKIAQSYDDIHVYYGTRVEGSDIPNLIEVYNNAWATGVNYQDIYIESPNYGLASNAQFIHWLYNIGVIKETTLEPPVLSVKLLERVPDKTDVNLFLDVYYQKAPATQTNRFYLDKPFVRINSSVVYIKGLVWEQLVGYDISGKEIWEVIPEESWGKIEPDLDIEDNLWHIRTVIPNISQDSRYTFYIHETDRDSNGVVKTSQEISAWLDYGTRRLATIAEGYMQGANDKEPVRVTIGMFEDENGNVRGTLTTSNDAGFNVGSRGVNLNVLDDFFDFSYTNGLSIFYPNRKNLISVVHSELGIDLRNQNQTKGYFRYENEQSQFMSNNATIDNNLFVGSYMFTNNNRESGGVKYPHLTLKYYGGE